MGTDVDPPGAIPRAIPKEYWDIVCPDPVVIKGDDFLWEMGVRDSSALEITEAFIEYVNRLNAQCVEIKDETWNVYDLWYELGLRLSLSHH